MSLRKGPAPACLCTITAKSALLLRLHGDWLAFSISYPLSRHATAALVYSPSQYCLFEMAVTHSTTICRASFLYSCYYISVHTAAFTVYRCLSVKIACLIGSLRWNWLWMLTLESVSVCWTVDTLHVCTCTHASCRRSLLNTSFAFCFCPPVFWLRNLCYVLSGIFSHKAFFNVKYIICMPLWIQATAKWQIVIVN